MSARRAFALRRKLPRNLASAANVGVMPTSWALDLKRLCQSQNEPRIGGFTTACGARESKQSRLVSPESNAVPHCLLSLDLDQTRLRHFACTDVAAPLS